ncbi:hypothetical protein I4U23_015720 [Adineta vaga]|nr:hypothetical protein I4U23_015720 [Adineta vaga]
MMMNFFLYYFTVFIIVTNGIDIDVKQDRCKRQTSNTCLLMPQATEGPYYWNATYNRPNITENRPGIRFTLHITVIEVGTCQPIPRAAVDIWHCDAIGLYSHFINASLGAGPLPGMNGTRPPGPPPGTNGTRPPRPPGGGNRNTDNTTFLRGLQVTNDDGKATFYTIYPGWYVGRATHIHIKVHINGTYVDESGVYTGGYTSHTGQLFFDDLFTDQVGSLLPYISHNVTRVRNNIDGIFNGQGGNSSVLSVNFIEQNLGFDGGVIASIILGINSSSIPDPVEGGGGPPPPPTSTIRSLGNVVTVISYTLILFHFIALF